MKKAVLLAVIFSLIFAITTFAEMKTFVREYTYEAGEADSKLTSRAIALEQVKRLVLEELGTYLQSNTEVKNFTLSKDQIITMTGGIVKVTIIGEKWSGDKYWMKAEIKADPDQVANELNNIPADSGKTKEFEDLKSKTDLALSEIERLKKELAESKGGESKKALEAEYLVNTNKLTAAEWYEKAYALGEDKKYTEAIDAYTKSLELSPDYFYSNFNRGVNNYNAGNYEAAIADYSNAIDIDPEYTSAYRNRGQAYDQLNKTDLALADYSKALELDPSYSGTFFNRAVMYYNNKEYQNSIDDYTKVISLKPDYTLA